MIEALLINGRRISSNTPTYIVAEMSANHGHDLATALRIVEAAKKAGADAIKLQTYTPDTMTIDSPQEPFVVRDTLWAGRTLYDLYSEAHLPWEWHAEIKSAAEAVGLDFFSTPFDESAVAFLENLGVPVYKVASFELTDLPLLRCIGATGKPVIMSTGMATVDEITEAVTTLRKAGSGSIALLKCTSAYPARPDEMHLRTIPDMAQRFNTIVGLSDHTMDSAVAIVAIGLGARIIEKHLTLSRSVPGPDSAFSLEPDEFERMVTALRIAEQAMGETSYGSTGEQKVSKAFRRSLFVVTDIKKGERFTAANLRVIRPAAGLPPADLESVLGRYATRDISRGTPLAWEMVDSEDATAP